MPTTEPRDILIQAILVKWDADADLVTQFGGRVWQNDRDTATTANPASGNFYPYAIIPAGGEWISTRIRQSCGNDYWQHQIAFKLYSNSFAQCAALVPFVAAVFSKQSLGLALAAGGLVKNKENRVRYLKETEGVHFAELSYEFETSLPLRP